MVALVFCIPTGLYFVSITVKFLGIVLGARRLGVLTVVLCVATTFVSYLISQEVGR